HFFLRDEADVVNELDELADVVFRGRAGGKSVGDCVSGFGAERTVLLPGSIVGRGFFCLHSDDANGGTNLLRSVGDSANQIAIADGNQDNIGQGGWFEIL